MADVYKLEFFAEDDGTMPVLAWIKNDLTAAQRRAVGTAMRRVLQANGVGVCASPWGKQLGDGLFESASGSPDGRCSVKAGRAREASMLRSGSCCASSATPTVIG
jgi:hypothetical protein